MTHGKQCGFAGVFKVFPPWSTEKIPPGDLAIENIALQERNFSGSREKFINCELPDPRELVKKREGLRESGGNPQGIKLNPEISQKSRP